MGRSGDRDRVTTLQQYGVDLGRIRNIMSIPNTVEGRLAFE